MAELLAERDLIDAAVAGDAAAVEQLLFAYYTPLQQHIEQKMPDRAQRHFSAEDILQQALPQVFRDIGRFELRGEGSFFAWLRAIADHRLIDALRKVDRGAGKQLSMAGGADASSWLHVIDLVCHDSASPSKHACGQEAAQAIQIAIASLPADQQEVIRAHCLEQKSVEEIARETGRTEAAVRGLVHRGKKKLAEVMGRSSNWLSSG